MQVASLSETLTVTGESPLVDVSSTQVAGNVDRRQMEELPLQGRNWMELAMQVKGITANAVDTTPGVRDRAVPAESRRPGDHAAGRRLGLRPAEVQPRGDRRVPGRHQPVRHHAGPLARHPGAGDLALGHQQLRRQRLRLLPRRQVEREGLHRQPRAAVREPADRRRDRRTADQGQDALLRVVRARERAEHDPRGAGAAAGTVVHLRYQADSEQLPRPRRLAGDAERSLHRARVVLGLGQRRSRRSPAPSIRRRPPRATARRSTSSAPGPRC